MCFCWHRNLFLPSKKYWETRYKSSISGNFNRWYKYQFFKSTQICWDLLYTIEKCSSRYIYFVYMCIDLQMFTREWRFHLLQSFFCVLIWTLKFRKLVEEDYFVQLRTYLSLVSGTKTDQKYVTCSFAQRCFWDFLQQQTWFDGTKCAKSTWHIFWATKTYVKIHNKHNICKSDYAPLKAIFYVYKNPKPSRRLKQHTDFKMLCFLAFFVQEKVEWAIW